MSSASIQHALGLHLYQPTGNLRQLLQRDEGEAGRILRCYERLARHAHKYAEVARLHVALSVVLLEQLRDPELINACRHLADLPAILEGLRSAPSIELIGTGYRHAPLPLIPPEDWDEQLRSERVTIEAALGRVLEGYWPPASLFTPDMIPALVQAGYRYVLLPDAVLATPDGGSVDPYRAYRLSYQGASIVAVPLDRGFSQAQQTGLEAPWLADELRNGVALSPPPADGPYLLTTWSDGENGEWFRRLDEEQGFFGQFFSPYMEFCETGEFPVQPVHLSDHLRAHRPGADAVLRAQLPADALTAGGEGEGTRPDRERLFRGSARYWSLVRAPKLPDPLRLALPQARELILRAEDSGLLLGDADQRATMLGLLNEAERLLATDHLPAEQPGPSAPVLPVAPHREAARPMVGPPALAGSLTPTAVAAPAPKESAPAPNEPAPAKPQEAVSATPTDAVPARRAEAAARKPTGSGKRRGRGKPRRRS